MKQTYIELETDKIKVKGPLISEKTASNISKKSKSYLPNINGKEIPHAVITFGNVVTVLFEKERCFTYDPKPIIELKHGISQAIVRFLKTQKNHPPAGYHLKSLVENLEGEMENRRWWGIRESLKKDTKQLSQLGIIINFKDNRVFVRDDKQIGYVL